MLYSYFIDVKSVPCYNLIGKGDCSPSHHLVSCAIRRRIATARFIIAVIKIDFVCELVILVTAFLFGSFTQRLYLLSDSII